MSKGNQKAVFDTIKSLVGQANILTIPRAFIDLTGSLDAALFLSQSIYWSDKGQDGWFYKTYQEWTAETSLSEYQIRKAAKMLGKMDIIETAIKKANGNPTVHYRVDIAKLSDWFLKKLQKRKPKNFRNYPYRTEITTETTERVSNMTRYEWDKPYRDMVDQVEAQND